jgi:hypothetical protein
MSLFVMRFRSDACSGAQIHRNNARQHRSALSARVAREAFRAIKKSVPFSIGSKILAK